MSDDYREYTPDSSLARPFAMLREMFADLLSSRELAWRLAVRDISAQYRQAALGVLWAFILPLANAVTWIFLNRGGIVSVGETDLPYPLYVLTGTTLWAMLTDAINAPLLQTQTARNMLAKLNFPREALVLSGVYQTLFNAAIKLLLLAGALLLFRVDVRWEVLLFPLGVLSLVFVGTALGLLVTPLGVLYSDVGRALPLLLQLLMYTTPVVFPMPTSGSAATLFRLNPLTPLLATTRDWLTGMPAQQVAPFLAINAATIVLLLVVWIVYRLAMPILIERMNA
jgi:lipopolysaccharide transport system permease protein